MSIFFDDKLNRDIWKADFKKREYQFPALLGERYIPKSILAKGGFGVLIVAEDTHVFKRKVLIKKGLLPGNLFDNQNDRDVNRTVTKNNHLAEHERQMLLHGVNRNVLDIPVLIDWFDDIDPMLYGPHRDRDGLEFVIDDPKLYAENRYIVLNYFNGIPLDEYCVRSQVTRNTVGFLRFIGLYLANILIKFHRKEDVGKVKDVFFIYQDLKPDNILCSPVGTCQLIDFGSFAGFAAGVKPWAVGTGTQTYTAPEVMRNEKMLSPQSDIYSLGMLLKIVLQKSCGLNETQIKPEEDFIGWAIDDCLRTVLNRATAPEPADRYQTMRDMLHAMINIPRKGEVRNV